MINFSTKITCDKCGFSTTKDVSDACNRAIDEGWCLDGGSLCPECARTVSIPTPATPSVEDRLIAMEQEIKMLHGQFRQLNDNINNKVQDYLDNCDLQKLIDERVGEIDWRDISDIQEAIDAKVEEAIDDIDWNDKIDHDKITDRAVSYIIDRLQR